MTLSSVQILVILAMVTLGTLITRYLPFLLFPPNKKTPPYISYLGRVLPYAVIGLLVVYCLKGVSFVNPPFGLPEAIAIGVIAVLQIWKNNVLLSIGGGTVLYMVLVQAVF